MRNRRNAPPLVVLLLVVFAAPVLVDVEPLAALRYALSTALWWVFGWALVGRYTTGGFERATIGAAVGIGASSRTGFCGRSSVRRRSRLPAA